MALSPIQPQAIAVVWAAMALVTPRYWILLIIWKKLFSNKVYLTGVKSRYVVSGMVAKKICKKTKLKNITFSIFRLRILL